MVTALLQPAAPAGGAANLGYANRYNEQLRADLSVEEISAEYEVDYDCLAGLDSDLSREHEGSSPPRAQVGGWVSHRGSRAQPCAGGSAADVAFVCIVGVLSLPQTGGRRLQIFTELEEEERRSGGSVVRSPALHLPSGRDDGALGAAEGDDEDDGYRRGAGGAERMAGGRYESEAAKEALLERLLREYREGKKKSEEEGGMGLRSPDTQDGQPLEHLLLGESLLLTGQDENKGCVCVCVCDRGVCCLGGRCSDSPLDVSGGDRGGRGGGGALAGLEQEQEEDSLFYASDLVQELEERRRRTVRRHRHHDAVTSRPHTHVCPLERGIEGGRARLTLCLCSWHVWVGGRSRGRRGGGEGAGTARTGWGRV